MTDLTIYLESIAEELVVEELVDDQDLAEDDEEVGGLAGVEQHRIAVILVVEMLLRFTEIFTVFMQFCEDWYPNHLTILRCKIQTKCQCSVIDLVFGQVRRLKRGEKEENKPITRAFVRISIRVL